MSEQLNGESPATTQARHTDTTREDFFLGMVAHELRNPMTPLRVQIQLLRRRLGDTSGNPAVERSIDSIERNLERLEIRINEIQEAAHLRGGTLTVRPEPCDLVEIIHAAVDEQSATDLGQAHTIDLQAPDRLPGVWDRDRLHQAISNLILNALKYSPLESTVRIVVERDGNAVRVTVIDHGLGIAADDLDELFQPYSRLYQRTRVKGLGLGLFLTRGIIEAHGGRIEVTSDGPGTGSQVRLTIPLTPSETASRTSSPTGDSPAT